MPEPMTDNSGTLPVDWTIFFAGVVALGIAVLTVVPGGLEDIAQDRDVTGSQESTRLYHF